MDGWIGLRAGGRAGTQQRLAAGAVRLTATAYCPCGCGQTRRGRWCGGSAVEETRWMAGSCPVLSCPHDHERIRSTCCGGDQRKRAKTGEPADRRQVRGEMDAAACWPQLPRVVVARCLFCVRNFRWERARCRPRWVQVTSVGGRAAPTFLPSLLRYSSINPHFCFVKKKSPHSLRSKKMEKKTHSGPCVDASCHHPWVCQ